MRCRSLLRMRESLVVQRRSVLRSRRLLGNWNAEVPASECLLWRFFDDRLPEILEFEGLRWPRE